MSRLHRKVIILSLGFAAIGFALQLAIVLWMGFGDAWRSFILAVLVSVIGLVVGASVGAHIFGRYVVRENAACGGSILLGCLVGWFALWAQVLTGSSVEFFHNANVSDAFVDYIVKPAFWVMWPGSVPSWILGGLFGWTSWRVVQRSASAS